MTDVVWPTKLNYMIEQGSFNMSKKGSALRTDFEYGPARMRRRFTRDLSTQSWSLRFSWPEFEVFRSFWDNSLNGGVNWFMFPVWTGTQYAFHRIRFTEPPAVSDGGFGQTIIACKVEIDFLITLPWDYAEIVGELGADTLYRAANLVDHTVNSHWPGVW